MTSTPRPCQHFRADHVIPGWTCCQCHCYNGYQRRRCRRCGHLHCYDMTSERGREARELQPIGWDPVKVAAWLAKNPQPRRGDA